MVNYNYSTRPQPTERSHLGPLPTTRDTKERLNLINETNKEVNALKLESKLKSGDEFFYNMHSCYKKDGKIIRKNPVNIDNSKKTLKYIDFEISKIKKNMRNILIEPKGKHIRFDDEIVKEKEIKFCNIENIKEYLCDLELKRKDLLSNIQEANITIKKN